MRWLSYSRAMWLAYLIFLLGMMTTVFYFASNLPHLPEMEEESEPLVKHFYIAIPYPEEQFQPVTCVVVKGDTVVLHLDNSKVDTLYTIEIRGYLRVEINETAIRFLADKPGIFKITCKSRSLPEPIAVGILVVIEEGITEILE